MKRADIQAAIQAAELDLVLSKQQARESLERARGALLAKVTGPKPIGWSLGVSALVGFCMAPRRKAAPRNEIREGNALPSASVLPLLMPWLVRYAIAVLPSLLQSGDSAKRSVDDRNAAN